MNKTDVMSQIPSLNKSTHWVKPRNNLYHLIITSLCQRWFSMKFLEDKTGTESWAKGNPSKFQRRTGRVWACPSPGAAWAPQPCPPSTPGLPTQCWIFMKRPEGSGWFDLYETLFSTCQYKINLFWRFECFQASCFASNQRNK